MRDKKIAMLTVLMAFYTSYGITINDFLGVTPSFLTGTGIDLHYYTNCLILSSFTILPFLENTIG